MGRLESLVDAYAGIRFTGKNFRKSAVVDPVQVVKEQLVLEITTEIREAYKEEVYAEVKQQVIREQEQYKISQIKTILIESILLAALVGLVVNQATDIITCLKGGLATPNEWFVLITLVIVAILFFAIHLLINIRYLNGISQIIKDFS